MIDSLAEVELAPGATVIEARPADWKDVLRGSGSDPGARSEPIVAGGDGRGLDSLIVFPGVPGPL